MLDSARSTSMNSSPLFSVIIPTYHRNDLLSKCLDCLAPGVQTLSAERYEVIVTDDGSETTAEEMIRDRYPWAKWVAGSRKGPAANRNNGAKYARGKWLAFTDDDCIPDPNWLKAFAEAITGEALALEGAIHPLGDLNQDLAECPVNLTGGCFWSANIAVERSLFEKIGGFDPNYPLAAHEDQDLKLRLVTLTNILFVPDAYVEHPVKIVSLKEAVTRLPKRCYAFAYHTKKHSKLIGYYDLFRFILKQYIFHIRVSKISIIKRKYKTTIASIIMLLVGVPLNSIYIYFIFAKKI